MLGKKSGLRNDKENIGTVQMVGYVYLCLKRHHFQVICIYLETEHEIFCPWKDDITRLLLWQEMRDKSARKCCHTF